MQAWLLLVGDWERNEFAAARQWLETTLPALRCPQVAAACRRLGELSRAGLPGSPSAVVLAQSWPGQIHRRQVERLHALAPLARLVGLVGSWAEGPRRGDWAWPGVQVVPWHAWRWRLPDALGLSPTGAPSPRTLPKTATVADWIADQIPPVPMRASQKGPVAVLSSDRLLAQALTAMLKGLGFQASHVEPGRPLPVEVQAVVMDGWQAVQEHSRALHAASTPPRLKEVPHLLLLPFPRLEDLTKAQAAGFAAVLAQPVLLADLERVLARHSKPRRPASVHASRPAETFGI